MLVYLLCNRHRDVSIQEMGDVLWPDQSVASPYNMIKNIVLRTRRVLERVTDEQFIVINNGIYGINPELKITMESEAFESVYLMAKAKKLDAQQREALCERAMSLYGGTLFPTMANEAWLSARSAYYQLHGDRFGQERFPRRVHPVRACDERTARGQRHAGARPVRQQRAALLRRAAQAV